MANHANIYFYRFFHLNNITAVWTKYGFIDSLHHRKGINIRKSGSLIEVAEEISVPRITSAWNYIL